jgi:hypothetical protein
LAKKIETEVLLDNLLSISAMRQKMERSVSPQLLWENLLLQINVKLKF